jgi:hypothetical protein
MAERRPLQPSPSLWCEHLFGASDVRAPRTPLTLPDEMRPRRPAMSVLEFPPRRSCASSRRSVRTTSRAAHSALVIPTHAPARIKLEKSCHLRRTVTSRNEHHQQLGLSVPPTYGPSSLPIPAHGQGSAGKLRCATRWKGISLRSTAGCGADPCESEAGAHTVSIELQQLWSHS